MKLPYSFLLLLSGCLGFGTVKKHPVNTIAPSSFYDLKAKGIDGNEIDFSQYNGKKVLIVNTASKCGFTPQYKELEKFYKQYKNRVEVIGFPCNDFGGQEPGQEEEIKNFCEKNYGVTFQLFSKISVKGKDQSPVYKWLTDPALNGWNKSAPVWNFCKYLINEHGELVGFYGSTVKPFDKNILEEIEK